MTNIIKEPVLYPSTFRHDYYSFLVYDENGKLQYSRYNFDYIKYASENNKLQLSNLNTGSKILYYEVDGPYVNGSSNVAPDFTQFNSSNIKSLGYIVGKYNEKNVNYNKMSIWQDFWANINGDYSLPYNVPENMKQYFTPITSEIQKYVSKYGVFHGEYCNITAVDNLLIEPTVVLPRLSSELINFTDRQIRRIQDYYFIEPPNTFIYSKYNFDFEQYSIDFKMVDTHLVLFTDFYVRNKVLNGVANFVLGEGIYPPFKKYFKQSPGLVTYLETNSVLTNFYAGLKSFNNIDFEAFVRVNNLQDSNPQETFMTTYQFQQLQVPFFTNKDSRNSIEKSSCCVVFQENVGTGFLIDISSIMNDNKQYLITDSNLFTASFNVTTFFAIFQQNGINTKVQFKVVGFVKYAGFLLGVFDPLLPYNQAYGINTLSIPSIPIVSNNDVLNGEKLYATGSYDMSCPFNLISGFVTDNVYTHNFQIVVQGLPESILLDASSKKGCFGGPVWKEDDLGNPILVGMLTRSLYNDQLSVVCKIEPILTVITLNSQNKAPQPINYAMYLRKLSIVSKYVHPLLQEQYPMLNNLNYIGGIHVTNIILGYNTSTDTPIYSINNINYKNVKLINNLFVGTNFYNYVLSGNGVVIKSLNGVLMGKFFGQRPYSDFVYGVGPFKRIGTKPIPSRFTGKYVNSTVNVYNPIVVEYFFYDSNEWKLTSETIGIDINDYMYVEDSIGTDMYVQHKSEYPVSLISYMWNDVWNDM